MKYPPSSWRDRNADLQSGSPETSLNSEKELYVLLLEDSSLDAELMIRELRRAGLKVSPRRVDSRDEFLRELHTSMPDVILADYSMPQFTALEALDLLHERALEIPFVLVTGSQSEEVAVQCMKEGADDYILKTSLKRLPGAVVNALRKKEAEHERSHATQALKRSEEHFRRLIENALDIIAIVNLDGLLRYASPSVRVLGYAPADLVGRSLWSFVSTDDSREMKRVIEAAVAEPRQIRIVDFVFRHRDGSWRVLEAICKGGLQMEGEPPGVVLNARDVSERKQAEAAIEKLAAFPRLNPNPIFELSADGKLTYCNQAAEAMAGLVGRSHASEILPLDTADIVAECLHTGETVRRETSMTNRIFSWSFFPIITSQVVHCYATDMTERVQLEAQLRQSQKMESIGQLAAGVAHDFNNILTVIQGYAGLVADDEKLDPELAEPLQEIAIGAERAANLTRQLLTFSRKQVMQTSDVNLNEVLGNVTKLLRRILGEDVLLQINYEQGLPPIHADSGMIEQIIMNLAVNARDAMPRGGKLTVSTQRTEITAAHSHFNPEARPGSFVCLRVTDTGCGIPPDLLPRIFEPFFTTKEVGKGTGLGLATVYGIAKQHQGWIEVLSERGAGTTFRVFLPASSQEARLEPATEPSAGARGGRERILVVEDEPEVRSLVREILEQYGYEVLEASSGPTALPVWEQNRDRIDMLLTDMVMPGNMTGRELAEKLRQQRSDLPVLYTSGYSIETLGKDFQLKRGVNFLPKPYHPMTLIKAVRECLDSHIPKPAA